MRDARETILSAPFNPIHPSVLRRSALPSWVSARRRSRGALRYQCPATGSFVLLTDPAALAAVSATDAPVRCPSCGDMHLLAPEPQNADIVGPHPAA
jgi:hypothetical protein